MRIDDETVSRLLSVGALLLLVFGIVGLIELLLLRVGLICAIIMCVGSVYMLVLGLYLGSAEGILRLGLRAKRPGEIWLIVLGSVAATLGSWIAWGLGSIGGVVIILTGVLILYRRIMGPAGPPEIEVSGGE